MPLMFKNGKLLFRGGRLAFSPDCCCATAPPPQHFQGCTAYTTTTGADLVEPHYGITVVLPSAVDLTIGSAANALAAMCMTNPQPITGRWSCNELSGVTFNLLPGTPLGADPCTWYKTFQWCCEINGADYSIFSARIVRHGAAYKWNVFISLLDNGPGGGGPCLTPAGSGSQTLGFLSGAIPYDAVNNRYLSQGSWNLTQVFNTGDPGPIGGFAQAWCDPLDALTLDVTP